MNSIFRRINSHNVNKIFNFNFRQFSFINNQTVDLFGAKRVVPETKAVAAGNKTANVSTMKLQVKKAKAVPQVVPPVNTKPARKKTVPVVEEEEEEVVVAVKPKRQKAVQVVQEVEEVVVAVKPKRKKTAPVEEVEEVVVAVKPKRKPATASVPVKTANTVPQAAVKRTVSTSPVAIKTKAAAINVSSIKKKVAEKKPKELAVEEVVEEQHELIHVPTTAGKKTPKKAAHTSNVVHTLQTEPVKTEEKVEAPQTTAAKSRKKKEPTENVVAAKKGRPAAKQVDPNEFPVVDLNNPNSLGSVSLDTPLDPKRYTTNPLGLYEDFILAKSSEKTKLAILREKNYLCNNYAPLPVICAKGNGVYLQDIDGKIYIDFLSAYSAANQGHCNKNIIQTATNQMNNLYITSRAFYNNVLGTAAEYVCKVFKYEKILFMNSGAEGCESAIKIARRWGYLSKKIPEDQAKIVYAKGNWMGRTITLCGLSDDPLRYKNFGPYDKSSHYLVEYNNIQALREVLENDSNVCAIFLEPIQGENGVVIPSPGYLKAVSDLCKEKNVLFISDEIQTGCGRTGFPLYTDSEGVHPDILILGKSLSGGLYPVSAVLSSTEIMDLIKPGEHGSTYGGNPLAAHITISAIHELIQGGLVSNAYTRGIEFGLCLKELAKNNLIKEIRGRGLMYGVELYEDCGFSAYDISLWLFERGILCKPTKSNILR